MYIIEEDNKPRIIYPQLEIIRDNKRYIIYRKQKGKNNYIGQITKDQKLIPIEEYVIENFKEIINTTYKEEL